MPDVILSPNDAAALIAVTAGGLAGAPITEFIVSVLKKWVLKDANAGTISFVTSLALTVIFWIARYFGREVEFRSIVEFVLVAGPAFIALFSTVAGASLWYGGAKRLNVPVLGFSKPGVG